MHLTDNDWDSHAHRQGYSEGMTAPATPSPDSTADKPPRPRRWIPLSLKMFAAILMLLGVASALFIWAFYSQSQERQREQGLVQDIGYWGGSVVRVPGGSEWLRRFASQDGPISVQIFERISFIRLDGTATTDAGLSRIRRSRLTSLEGVSLDGTAVTDAGLRQLSGLTRLRHVRVSRTAVTDAGLAHLSGLTNLQELFLDGTAVTDVGLVRLHGLTGLRVLGLTNTRVSSIGVAELQRALPDLSIDK